MQEIKRRYVIPGDKIIEGNYKPLMNVVKSGNYLVSTRVGIAEAGKDGVKVIPLSGVYIPRVNDLVIGKIIDRSSLSWDVDINACFFAHLPAQDVFGRDFSPAKDDMGRQLSIGDLIIARIVSFDRTRDPMLTVQDKDLGKIPYGEFIKISPTRVPRLIGKRGSMIQTIEQATQTRVIIGQNGIVVVTGRDPDGLSLAAKAIKMVEEESHTTNLTQRVKTLLNVQDPVDPEQPESMNASPGTESSTQPQPQPNNESSTQPQPQPNNESSTQPQPQPNNESSTQPQPQPNNESSTQPQPQPNNESSTQPQPQPNNESSTQPQPQPNNESSTQPQPQPNNESSTPNTSKSGSSSKEKHRNDSSEKSSNNDSDIDQKEKKQE
ncbi:exosome complex RNA-binding protein Rrp4 [Candidatus Nitrosocosmicus oleophilus]|uniref:Exosome complex component Rrp4 n=1 Tax=Candidatus Nitrosocosmicus oleophilus TaxID=1353260 RepID=A0A654LVX0_9ARCH|nr:exosome complex RNA-binding protein Rrp4 [Candidatus Nitrosocosmicus oleophilus]ALI34950.1 exosome complex RNA-binding protein Rrp4 [Candidatus Nitrosocosmicus oleophilus]